MPIRILTDSEYEYLAQLQYDNNRALSTSYLSQYLTRPDVAAALSANQQAYPHLTPGAAMSLAKANQGPDSPLTQQVAQAAAERRVKKGGGWGVIGDVLTSATSYIGKAVGFITAVQPFDVKASTRLPLAGLSALSEGIDVLTAQTARNISEKGVVGGLLSPFASGQNSIPATIQRGRTPATTTAGIALEPGFDLGSGFFPGGSAREEQAKRQRSIYEVDGHAATLGRIAARTVFEPGTRPYNLLSGVIDTGVDVGLDPAVPVLRAAGATRQAARLLDPATPSSQTFAQSATSALLSPFPRVSRADVGLLETPTRWTVDDNAARSWLVGTNSGKNFLRDVSTHSSTNYFRTTYNLPLHVSRELADARTEPEVLDTFSRHFLSGVLREKPHARIAPDIRPSSRLRLAGSFPREQYALRDDLDQAASQLEAHLHNAGIRGEVVDYYIDRLARLPDQTDFATANEAFDQIFKDAFSDIADRIAGQVDATGSIIGKGSLRVGEKVYLPDRMDRGEVVSAPYAKIVTAKERVPGVRTPREISGEELYVRVRVADRAAPIELPVTTLSVHLPQTRLRNMMKVVSDDLDTVHDDITDELATDSPRLGVMVDSGLDDLEPAHAAAELLNGAITLPSIREIRQLATTYGRFLNSSSLSFVPNMFDAFYRVWRPVKILTGASMVRNIGEGQVRMAAAGIRPPAHPLQIIGNILGRGKKALSDDGSLQEDFLTSSQELGRLLGHTSRAWLDNQYRNTQQLLRSYDPSFSSSWADEIANLHSDLTTRRLAGFWDDVDDFTPTGHNLKDTQEWFWTRQVPKLKEEIAEKNWPGYLRSRGQSDKFISQAQSHLEHLTRGDTRLLESIAYGTLDGTPAITATENGFELADSLLAYTRAQTGLPNTPNWIKAPTRLPDAKRRTWDTMVNALFRNLYDTPTEKAVVIPTFRGFYFKRAQELLPRLTREAQERVLTIARDAGLPRSELRNLARAMLDSTGDLTFDEFDAVAKSFASDSSRKLLYEFSAKRQFGDAYRLFFPFYDAWRDMIATYPRLLAQNPAAIRRFQVTVQAARGNDADPGTGFFHIDPETNEEVFSYPFSGHLTRGLTSLFTGGEVSVNQPLTGNVQNLNQFSHTFLPGVGPVIQWPVSRLIPDRPDTDWLHNVVNPVGAPNLSGTVTSPWMSNIIRGFTADMNKDRNYANTHADAVRYLMSTGKYDPGSESDMRIMSDKAAQLAKATYYLRALVGWIAPSQPRPEWRAYDSSGRLLTQYKMSQAFHEMADNPDIGYDNALLAFIANFGEKNILAITGRSVGTSPDNKSTYDWMRENPDLVRDYPDAYSFFAPRSAERAPFEAYTQSFAAGERRLLTEREWYARGNDMFASMLYYSAKEIIGPKPAKNQTEWLRSYRSFLRQKYPGFDPGPTDSGRQDRIIEQLYEAANDGILATTTTGKAIQIYLTARDQAIESAARGKIVNWGQAKSTRNIRAWLRSRASEITARYPEFERVWDQVFSREMQEDA